MIFFSRFATFLTFALLGLPEKNRATADDLTAAIAAGRKT
jgi:hypothetical protein